MSHQKVGIITGATSGIGLALSKLLLEQSYKVYALSLSQSNWESAKDEVNHHPDFYLNTCDVSDDQSVKKVMDEIVAKECGFDILVNNAGYIDTGFKLEAIDPQEFYKNVEVNLYGVYHCCRHAIKHLQSPGKTIINISSNAGKRAVPTIAAYSAAKFGVVALSQSIAKENEDNGLKCFTVCPGGTNTRMRERIFGDAANQQSADFVAKEIWKAVIGETHIDNGGDMIIRHNKVEVNPVPGK